MYCHAKISEQCHGKEKTQPLNTHKEITVYQYYQMLL